MLQPSFFDLDDRQKKLDEKDPLVHLNQLIDWEDFRTSLKKVRDKNGEGSVGRMAFYVVLMFKVLVLEHLYSISDDGVE